MNKTRKRWLLFVFALCMVMLAKPTNAMAASKKYVRSLTVAKKTVSITKGKTKKVAYKVKVKGKASKKVTVKTSNKKVTAKVKGGKIVITAKKAGISKITITTKGKNKKKKKIKKYIKVKISKAATQIPAVEVTRSEWIAVIMKASAYDVQEELFTKDETGKIVYSFSDIQNDANAKIIETAAKYGIIPNENSMFYPDAAADREFAAVTAVRAAGFKAEQANLSCNDRNSLKYPAEDTLAVNLKMLSLVDGNFLPERAVSKQEKQNIENILTDIVKQREIDTNHKDVIQYADDVKIKEDAGNYRVSERNGVYTVLADKGTLLDEAKKGEKILLPETEDYPEGIALYVSDSILLGDKRIITGSMPENLDEFVDAMDMEGVVKADTATAINGVSTVKVTKGNTSGQMRRASIGGNVNLEDKTKIEYTIPMIETTVTFYISELQYKIDFNKKGVKELYVNLPNVLNIETKFEAKDKFSKQIGTIPIKLKGGFSVELAVFLETEVGGKIHMTLNFANEVGVQYYNGELIALKSCKPSLEAVGEADADIGLKGQVGMYWMKGVRKVFGKSDPKPLYNIYTKWGVRGEASIEVRNDKYTSYKALICIDLASYLYGNWSVGDGSVLGDKFNLKKTWTIFDKENSPLKLQVHIENGKMVQSCTYQNPDTAFIEYVKQFRFLCDGTTTYNGYIEYTGSDYKTKVENLELAPLAYDIADYDSDGDDELLIVNTEPFQKYGSSVLKLQMYEAEKGEVKLKAEQFCYYDGEEKVTAIEIIRRGSTRVFKYQENGQWIIAIEQNVKENYFDGHGGERFVKWKYDGDKIIEQGKIGFDSMILWYDANKCEEVRKQFLEIGLAVDLNKLFEDVLVYDYIQNPVVIGTSRYLFECLDEIRQDRWTKCCQIQFSYD